MKENDNAKQADGFVAGESRILEIDILLYIKKVCAKWKTLLIFGGCAAVIGVIIGFSMPKEFKSVAVIAPEITTRAASGGLTSLANLAGINVSSMAVTDAMHPDMYPAIVGSTSFLVSMFDMPVDVETKYGEIVHTDLFDYMSNYTKVPWWSHIFGFPFKCKDWIVGLFKSEPEEDESVEGIVDSLRLTKQQESVAKALGKSIEVSVEKKTYLLIIKAKMQDRIIAAQLVNNVIEKLQDFVIGYRAEKMRQSVDYYREQVEIAKTEYLKAQHSYAGYLDRHQEVMQKSFLVESQRLQNEAQLRYQMYNSMSQNLMQAESKLTLEAPVLVTIQPPLAPNNGSPSKVKLMILFFFLGLIAGSIFVLVKPE